MRAANLRKLKLNYAIKRRAWLIKIAIRTEIVGCSELVTRILAVIFSTVDNLNSNDKMR